MRPVWPHRRHTGRTTHALHGAESIRRRRRRDKPPGRDGTVRAGPGAWRSSLRVPLHAEEPGARGAFERLDEAVLGMRGGPQAGPEPVQRLVVVGVDDDLVGAEAGADLRTRRQDQPVVGAPARVALAVLQRPSEGGQVLVQAAAFGHVDQLDAATDTEHRLARGAGGAVERQLEGVALVVDRAEVGVRHLIEAGRVHVGPPRSAARRRST